ncbi:MAG TPA: sigma-70 family RNA polymerase sigma factor [Flavisolibacter sp.]|nr:sigma-70 family RNA polymerase sigma factor [Flavisolibacter sp.]
MQIIKPHDAISERISAAKAGDEESWKALYHTFYPAMFAVALRMCRDTDAAADLVQDSFITGYLKLDQLADQDKFGAWLKQILVRHAYRSLAKKRLVLSLENIAPNGRQQWIDETGLTAEKLWRQQRLTGFMASLPDVLNSTILLRYFSGFHTYEEIAAILHIPIGTVRSRLNQAKKMLRDQWQTEAFAGKQEKANEEWNAYYAGSYGGMHANDGCKSVFTSHIEEADVVFPSGSRQRGGKVFEQMIESDRSAGSWLRPVNISSSGSISIIESIHFNSSAHPHHCPQRSVLVVYRKGAMASKVFVHAATK